ncbi:MAG: hypothetical protein PQJ61_06785 [Spirochaetales bacterium]|uniref:Uncharacterized protein n=1 Tax=Candidatus Thalassospirochaeta sargassi TaxID=3119039 RepID=A0AAJ1IBZ2_9SPIO|nr:hypothetical protein [Spirochaetales bacterium]
MPNIIVMYYQQTLTDSFMTSPAQADISSRIIDELRDLYFGQFDNYFFVSLLEQNAFDQSRLRSIQNMLEIQSVYSTETVVFYEGIDALEEMILTSKRYLLPTLRDKLKISGFYKNSSESREDVVMRNLFSYTFPYNLQRLEELVTELKKAVQ